MINKILRFIILLVVWPIAVLEEWWANKFR